MVAPRESDTTGLDRTTRNANAGASTATRERRRHPKRKDGRRAHTRNHGQDRTA